MPSPGRPTGKKQEVDRPGGTAEARLRSGRTQPEQNS